MMAAERVLQTRQPPGRGRKAFDGAEFGAVRLHRKREAGTRRHAVNLDGASTTDAVLTADVRASHAKLVAQEVGKQHTWLGVGLDRAAVKLEPHAVVRIGDEARHRRAPPMVARPSRRTSARRYSAVACKSSRASRSAAKPSSASSSASPSTFGKSRAVGQSATPPIASRTPSLRAMAAQATIAKSP